jgi:hypothetical protein
VSPCGLTLSLSLSLSHHQTSLARDPKAAVAKEVSWAGTVANLASWAAQSPSPSPSISGLSLSGPSLSGPSLSGPSLSGPSLSDPSLSGPSLSGPSLSGFVIGCTNLPQNPNPNNWASLARDPRDPRGATN